MTAPERRSRFVDECNLNARGGDGGAGAVSVRREAHVPRGGPDGGDGGAGGDVWLVADRNIASLSAFADHPHRRAESGKHGAGKKMHGASGASLDVVVPEGTVAYDFDGKLLADLVHHGDRWLAAAGGRGGRGNARFLSNRRRAPSFAEQGEKGEERWMRLELKLLADVALVGFPNVGKSTLISRISAARPKIADYPFTTLEPNLGVVRRDDGTEMVVADIPGLIEGASEGKGLGLQFLRHIERARVLVLLVDLAEGTGLPDPSEQERILLRELERYRPELLDRPRIVVGSRSDVAGDAAQEPGVGEPVGEPVGHAPEVSAGEPARLDGGGAGPGLRMSAVTGQGVDRLVDLMASAVQGARDAEPEQEAFIVHRPVADGFRVEREGDGCFVVTGREAERAVALSDLTNPDALDYAQHRLRKLGVDRALARAGAEEGDCVRIGGLRFDFEPD